MTKTMHDVVEVIGLINGSKKIQATYKGQLVYEFVRNDNGQWDFDGFIKWVIFKSDYTNAEAVDHIIDCMDYEPECDWVFFPTYPDR